MDHNLFDDIKAAERVMGKELSLPADSAISRNVAAIERGQRTRVDGTTETYERVEFDN